MKGLLALTLLLLSLAAPAAELQRDARPASRPASYELLQLGARARAQDGRLESALGVYSRLLERYPGDADALLGRGRVLAWMGRHEESLADLRRVTAEYPGYADAWRALGDLQRWRGLPAEAEAAYLRALEAGADPSLIASLMEGLGRRPRAWTLRLGHGLDAFDGGERESWRCSRATLSRRFSSGSLSLGWEHWKRFGLSESRGLAEAWRGFWPGAQGHLRLALAPGAETLPEADIALDLTQALAGSWELSLGGRRMQLPGDDVTLAQLALARYQGRWYLRARLDAGGLPGESELGALLSARRYLGAGEDFLELAAGHTRPSSVDSGLAGETGQLVLLRAQRRLAERLALALDLERQWPSAGPDMSSLRLHLLMGI